jgi:hypothetical protein
MSLNENQNRNHNQEEEEEEEATVSFLESKIKNIIIN